MTTYLDSSALVPMYVPEKFSACARVAVQKAGQVPFTALHQLEVPNAIEMLVGRGLLTRDEGRAIQRLLGEDLEHQRLSAVSLDLEQVFIGAARLSREHTTKLLTRSLDLLHVSAAHALGCSTFVSADDRQLAVARASGLLTTDIKRRSRPKH
ncbi:MAG: type II toxin-antitoxin system VapC family toxin [Steroidobacteraceae bacterium]|jgi:predicted nucleic acid-binding protein